MSSDPREYHSALGKAMSSERRERYEDDDGNVALVNDLMDGELPGEFDECDVYYSDLAWRPGFEKFNRRARVDDDRTYNDYLAAVRGHILSRTAAAVVMVTGLHAKKKLPPTDYMRRVVLNGAKDAIAYVYTQGGAAVPDFEEGLDCVEVLHRLAQSYSRVGDFCCGYGRSGRIFAEHGKAWTLADYNAGCIGMVARNAPTWGKLSVEN